MTTPATETILKENVHVQTINVDSVCTLSLSSYESNDSPAIYAWDDEECEYAFIATVNLEAWNITPAKGNVIIKTEDENKGIYEALLTLGIIGQCQRIHTYGNAGTSTALECPIQIPAKPC